MGAVRRLPLGTQMPLQFQRRDVDLALGQKLHRKQPHGARCTTRRRSATLTGIADAIEPEQAVGLNEPRTLSKLGFCHHQYTDRDVNEACNADTSSERQAPTVRDLNGEFAKCFP